MHAHLGKEHSLALNHDHHQLLNGVFQPTWHSVVYIECSGK